MNPEPDPQTMGDAPAGTPPRRPYVLWGLLALSFIACYWSAFQWLIYKFDGQDSYYSHGYLIPFVCAYLIYLKRAEIGEEAPGSSPAGLGLILFALLVHVLGTLGAIHFISGFSMVFYCVGASLYLFGTRVTRIVAFPLFFLVFMCPLPDGYINLVAIPFKSMATSIALALVDAMGIPFVREGFVVHLAQATFVVGTPCNGMRSLISFAALGFLLVYLFPMSLWKKALFLAVIPPLSLVLNGTRIAILLWIADRFGEKAASPESYLHDGSGMLVFILGFLAMIILMRRFHGQKTS